jgi:hypothetical protein
MIGLLRFECSVIENSNSSMSFSYGGVAIRVRSE